VRKKRPDAFAQHDHLRRAHQRDVVLRQLARACAPDRIPFGPQGVARQHAGELGRIARKAHRAQHVCGEDGGRFAQQILARRLVDQQLNEGVPVPFFGRPAMTGTATAALAMRFRCKVLPLRLERLPGTRFRVTIFPAMPFPDEADQQLANLAFMTDVNRMLEDWIRERPEQWFWVHRRWPDS